MKLPTSALSASGIQGIISAHGTPASDSKDNYKCPKTKEKRF